MNYVKIFGLVLQESEWIFTMDIIKIRDGKPIIFNSKFKDAEKSKISRIEPATVQDYINR